MQLGDDAVKPCVAVGLGLLQSQPSRRWNGLANAANGSDLVFFDHAQELGCLRRRRGRQREPLLLEFHDDLRPCTHRVRRMEEEALLVSIVDEQRDVVGIHGTLERDLVHRIAHFRLVVTEDDPAHRGGWMGVSEAS